MPRPNAGQHRRLGAPFPLVVAREDAEPILCELGTPTHVGENGQGLVLKLAINTSLAVQMLAFAEGLLLAERSGIDRGLAIDVMTQSPIGSPWQRSSRCWPASRMPVPENE